MDSDPGKGGADMAIPSKSEPEKQDIPLSSANAAIQPDSLADNPSGITRFLDTIYQFFFSYFQMIGRFFLVFYNGVHIRSRRFYRQRIQRHIHRMQMSWLKVSKFVSKLKKHLLFHTYMFLKFFVDAWHVVNKGFHSHPKKSVPIRLFYSFRAFCRGVRNNAHIFITVVNYALPVITIGLLVHLVSYVFSLNFAVSVSYNDEHIGYIQNEAVYEQAAAKLQTRLLYQSEDELLETTPTFAVTIVDPAEIKSDAELTDTLIKSASANIVQATGITVDGKFLGAVESSSSIKSTLETMLNKYRSSDTDSTERVEFTKDVKLESGLYLQNNIREEEDILEILTSYEQQDRYYTVVSGDSPSLIAQKNDMSLDELIALNPDITENCPIGRQVLVNKSQPYLPVKRIRVETYNRPIAYSTNYNLTSSLYEGQQTVTVAGKEGVEEVTAEVSYLDGVVISSKELSSRVISEPVTQQIAKGTKVMPKVSGNIGPTSSYGFIRPINSGRWYVSQGYGNTSFSYGHNGIDIAASYGTPIMSVLPGTVTYAGWNGTYGNLVRISHSSTGIETWYAHCSRITVSVGDTVMQGQQIANVGATGRATGNHLHFRVIHNGVQRNPFDYLPNMF